LKAAIWVRVSTVEQTTANQSMVLQKLCASRGFEIVRTFNLTVSAYSGEQEDALEDVVAAASRGEFQVLVCWSLDRLERRGGEFTLALLGRLADRGIVVVSHQEPWVEDMREPMVRKMFVFMAGWMAESESRRRSERTRAGHARIRSEGKRIGREPGRKDDRDAETRKRRSDAQRIRRIKERQGGDKKSPGQK